MTNILTGCADNIVGKLIDLITAESRYVCCLQRIADDFEKEKKDLEAKWKTVGRDVEDAGKRAEDIRDDVICWQEQAENLIKQDTKMTMACFGGWCPNCIWRYRRGKELAQKTDDIRRLQGAAFERVGHAPHLPGVEALSSPGFIHFESRNLIYKQLYDALGNDNNYMTGLQGMGGSGKTTLAKEVGKKLKESGKKFDHVIFTTVSNAPDIKKIQDSIAGPLGLSLNDKNEWERCNILWKRLIDGEKILIILDDVWEHISFEEIGIPSSDNHKNCRVLLTTRDIRVCSSMGCSRPIQLWLLSEQDAWILFKKHAGINNNSSKNFQDKGEEITRECKGLPVAVAAIASTLKDRPLEEWDAALTALQNPTPMHDVDENLIEIYKCLRYSYDNMKSENAKRLFLLLSLFPEGTEVPIEPLTRIGTGVGLFGEVEQYHETRSQVLAAKNKLIDSCLLLKAEEGCVKMHDLVREVALWVANKEIQVIRLSDKNRKALAAKEKNIRYLLCDDLQVGDMDVFPSWFDGAKLEVLLIRIEARYSVKFPNAFFEKMTRLRVLLLAHQPMDMLALSLPFSVLSLTNIRSLILTSWKLGDISILGTLRSLETLDLENCSITELPSKITELEKLRLLFLSKCKIERNNPFEVIERCLALEELTFGENELPILDSVNEAKAIHQNRIFPALNRYYLQWDKEVDFSLISKCVCLPYIDALISEATFKYLVRRSEILQLKGVKGRWRNLIPEIVPMEDEGTNDLIELGLESCSKVQCLVNTKHVDSRVLNVFSKLVALKLESMDNLEELCSGALPVEFLRSLERLRIKQCERLQGISKLNLCNLKIMELEGCPMLVSLFQPSTARSLVFLKKLRIRKCEQLTNIITDERSEDEIEEEILDGDSDHRSYGSIFPNLKTLEIEGCHRLECILSVLYARDVPLLETIKVIDCDGLKHIFGRYQLEDQDLHEDVKDVVLGSLQTMELSGLPNCINVSLECYPAISSSVKRSSSRNGSKAKQLDPINLNIIPWSYFCCYHHIYRSKLRSATSIKMPVVARDGLTDCSISLDMKGIVKHFLTVKTLHINNIKVESIFIHNGLQIIGQQVSLGLQCLVLDNLPQMTYICEGPKNFFAFQNLKKLRIVGCAKLEVVFPASVLKCLPELDSLEIRECKEIKQIFAENVENQKLANVFSPKPCFPKLIALFISQCHKLKRFSSAFACDDLPNLELLIINAASELEELIGCEKGQQGHDKIGEKVKAELPKLKLLIFKQLSSLCQGVELQTVRHRVVQDCPKLSLTSTATLQEFKEKLFDLEDLDINGLSMEELYVRINQMIQSDEVYITTDTRVEDLVKEVALCFPAELHAQCASSSELPSSQINEESGKDFVGKVPDSEMPAVATSPTGLELTQRPSPSPLDIPPHKTDSHELVEGQSMSEPCLKNQQKLLEEAKITRENPQSIKRRVEEGTTSNNANIVTSSTYSKSASSQPRPLVTSQRKSYPHSESRLSETEKYTDKENEGHPINIPDFRNDDLISLSQPINVQELQSLEQKLPLIPSSNLTENVEETEAAISGEVPESTKQAIPTSDSELRRPSLTSLETSLHRIPLRLVDQESNSEPGFLDEQHVLGETIVTNKVAQIIIKPPHHVLKECSFQSYNFKTTQSYSSFCDAQSIEDIAKESVQGGSASEESIRANLSAGAEGVSLGIVVEAYTKPRGRNMFAQDTQVVEQGDHKPNEGDTRASPGQKIQNFDDGIQEVSLMDKESEIGVVSNDGIEVPPGASADYHRNHSLIIAKLGAFKHSNDLDDAQITLLAEAIVVYPHLGKVLQKFSMRFQALMLKTLADILLFLRNESTVSVTPERQMEFQRLCDEAVQLGFEKSWVDEMLQRVMVRDPKVERAKARLSELLMWREQLAQQFHIIMGEINSLSDFINSQNHCFNFL